jgi:drug/metabolite transporter (DMT)-like permease
LQIIFTGIPVWTAVLAFFVLGEEPLHAVGIIGAVLVIGAGLIVASELE